VAVPDAVALVDLALKATTAYERPDLASRLRVTRGKLADPNVRVLIVGEFKQGKSQLLNALVNAPVCPVDDDIATSLPTVVKYAGKASVTLVREVDPEAGGAGAGQRTEVPIEQLAQYVSEAGNPNNRRQLSYAEVGIPRRLLESGLVLVDTPGVGGLGSTHGAATMAALPRADAVLLVSDAAQEYTKPELDFLDAARRLCPNVACVVTKTDLYPHWRQIIDLDRSHLAASDQAGCQLFPVSSTLRLHALRTEDNTLMQESGYVELIQFLQRDVVGHSDDLDRRSVAQDVRGVAEQLAAAMQSELTAQEDPEKAAALIQRLNEAKKMAEELRQRSSRWQQTLNDGVQDLTSDIEYDLRDRLRTVSKEAEHIVEDNDPKDTWDQLVSWVEQQVSTAVSQNFVWAIQRAQYLAGEVAEHFGSSADLLPRLNWGPQDFARDEVDPLERPDLEEVGIGGKLFSGLRGGYSGFMMGGMAMSLAAGAALLNPIAAAGGLVFGGKTVHDELKRTKQRRQADAKMAVRRHIDDVTFQVGRDQRDMLRQMQRSLRDHFTALAEEMVTSLTESVQSASKAVQTDESTRVKRIRDLRAELDRVQNLAERAEALAQQAAITGMAPVGVNR
jgi:GTPase Era involved in 16S rRNA processing